MEGDEENEEEASTSKNNIRKEEKGDNRDGRPARPDSDDHKGDVESMSEDTLSNSSESEPRATNYSTPAHLKLTSHGGRKVATGGRNKKRRPVNKRGRVEKRKRPAPKPKTEKRASKRKLDKKVVDAISTSTIFTRRSSIASDICSRCRRKHCRRRFEYVLRTQFCEKCRIKIRNGMRYREKRPYREARAIEAPRDRKFMKSDELGGYDSALDTEIQNNRPVAIQIGSRSNMLSPLCVASNPAPAENSDIPPLKHNEITPEMIFEALSRLTMWKQNVPTTSILDYISRNYPVNTNKEELLNELLSKLTICVLTGIVNQEPNETWSLSCKLHSRKLTKNHVTLFWQLYADTLQPIRKIVTETGEKQKSKEQGRRNNAKEKTLTILDDDII